MAKVVWISDGGCNTGFGVVTHAIGERLVSKYGHDIHVIATNYRGDPFETNLKLYVPNLVYVPDVYGQSRFVEILGKVEPDVVVTLQDPYVLIRWLFENHWDTKQILLRFRPLMAYLPIDGYNQPPGWSVLQHVTNRVAMSKFGKAAMPESKLVYHGVDTTTFHPVSPKTPITVSSGRVITNKEEAKEAFGYPKDSFLVLRVDRNSGRKDFPATWAALVPVMRKYSDIIVHFHCQGSQDSHGVDLGAVFSRDQDTQKRFFLPDLYSTWEGWSSNDLAALYNAADLFVTTSRGEGFGMTITEALACGVPVIAQNVSAIPEVVGPGGILLEPERDITVPSGQDLKLANVGSFTEAIEHLYLAGGVRRKLGEAGRRHVSQFSWDFAADRFHEYITALAESPAWTAPEGGEEVLAHGTDDS